MNEVSHNIQRFKERYPDIEYSPKIKLKLFKPGEYQTISIKGNIHTRKIKIYKTDIIGVIDNEKKCVVTFLPNHYEPEDNYTVYDLQNLVKYKSELIKNVLSDNKNYLNEIKQLKDYKTKTKKQIEELKLSFFKRLIFLFKGEIK